MQIREILPEDAPEIARLHAQSAAYLRALGDTTDFKFSADIFLRDGFGENQAFWGLVMAEGEQLWGYCLYNFTYDTDRAMRILFVLDLLVDEGGRGKGIGKALMQAAETIAHEKACAALQWAVYLPNKAAIGFYEAFGGEMLDEIRIMGKDIG